MSKAPETCLYCKGTGGPVDNPCGFCEDGKPRDTQEDWDRTWGKLYDRLRKDRTDGKKD